LVAARHQQEDQQRADRRQEGDDGQQADRRQAHLLMWGAPRWPPTPPNARSAPGDPWRSSIPRVLIVLRGGPRDRPPHPPMLGAPRGTRGAPRSSACSSLVVGGPEIAPQPLQAKGATPPSDSPARCSQRPGEPAAPLDPPRAPPPPSGAPATTPPTPPPP